MVGNYSGATLCCSLWLPYSCGIVPCPLCSRAPFRTTPPLSFADAPGACTRPGGSPPASPCHRPVALPPGGCDVRRGCQSRQPVRQPWWRQFPPATAAVPFSIRGDIHLAVPACPSASREVSATCAALHATRGRTNRSSRHHPAAAGWRGAVPSGGAAQCPTAPRGTVAPSREGHRCRRGGPRSVPPPRAREARPPTLDGGANGRQRLQQRSRNKSRRGSGGGGTSGAWGNAVARCKAACPSSMAEKGGAMVGG